MPGILDMVQQSLGGDAVANIGQQLGVNPAQAHSAIGAALPEDCSATRYSCRMKGIAEGCALSSEFHAAASIAAGSSWTRMT